MEAQIYWIRNLRHSYSPRARVTIEGQEIDIKARHNDILNGQGSCKVQGRIEGGPGKLMGTIQKANGQIALSGELDLSGMIFVPEKILPEPRP